MDRPSEAVKYHTHLLRCSIEIEHSREYWQRVDGAASPETAEAAFSEFWFGARSMSRVEVLVTNFRERFDQFPPSLQVLHAWADMEPATRRIICHWHMQLADRLYREFTGDYLVARLQSGRTKIRRDLVVRWIDQRAPDKWTVSTRIQFSRKLLYSASMAGLLEGSRDPRQLKCPRVGDDALTYLYYLLRGVQFAGTLTDNPYVASVGLAGPELESRLRKLSGLRFRKQGDMVEFGWKFDGLREWAETTVMPNAEMKIGGTV